MTPELRYLSSMLIFLALIWSVTLSWFSLYLKIHFSVPLVGLWFGLMLFTLGFSYFFTYLPILQPSGKHQFNFAWFGLLVWIMFLNAGLLYETGGSINPLINLLLLPLALGMLILSPQYFIGLAVISAFFYLFVSSHYVPIMSMKVQSLQAFFAWYLHGSVLVFMLLVLFLALFILPLKQRLEKQKAILERQKKLALQNEYFMSIAGLALSSVHQLSTPLNTMALLTELMKNEVSTPEGKDYIETFSEQLAVCNRALETLRNRADYAQQTQRHPVALPIFLSELKQEFALIQQQSVLKVQLGEALKPMENFVLQTDPSLKLALLNLLDNAARYSRDFILITWQVTDNALIISILDHGGGVAESELSLLGKQPQENSHGLGMGVFLSRMIIERFHGRLSFSNYVDEVDNKTGNKTGLKAEIQLPKQLIFLKDQLEEGSE
ncbi:sensor histidine kinase KdpD [Hydrogenovibrio sp. JE_KL2]|uniref:sensor histidine kinase n=1 Tax=Hydrogenovibrio sp. JE_KL2 TaxID=2651188 RepID=UPI0015620325|nr:ATP-binding protein [Hydrogenovibrio sp. JE_KL2]